MKWILTLLLLVTPVSANDWGLFASVDKPSFDILGIDDEPTARIARNDDLGPDRVVIMHAEWCRNCPAAVADSLQGLSRMVRTHRGWTYGNTEDRMIQYVDADEDAKLAEGLNATLNGKLAFPFAGKIEGGEVVRAWKPGGQEPLDEWTLGWLYKGVNERPGGKITEMELPPDAQPTPHDEVENILKEAALTSSDIFVDHGCGYDARLLIAATKKHGCRGIGIEINPRRAASARAYVKEAGLSNKIKIIEGDAVTANVQGTVGFAYLWPEALEKLKPRIGKFRKFISYSHPVEGLAMQSRGNAYVWERPAVSFASQRAQPTQGYSHQSRPVAYYGGRAYTGRVCSNPGCSMCNAISRQLGR